MEIKKQLKGLKNQAMNCHIKKEIVHTRQVYEYLIKFWMVLQSTSDQTKIGLVYWFILD